MVDTNSKVCQKCECRKISNVQICYTVLIPIGRRKKVGGWGRAGASFHLKPRERVPVRPPRNFDLLFALLKSTVDQ